MKGNSAGVVAAFRSVRVAVAATLATIHTITWNGLIQIKIAVGYLGIYLIQRIKVINHPEATALRGGNQVVVFDGQVGNRYNWQIELERLPVGAVVERNVHARFSTSVEQASPLGIGAYNAGKMVFGNAIGDFRPGFAVIFGVKEVGLVITRLITGSCHVHASLVEWISVNTVEHDVLGRTRWRYIGPVFARITGNV